MQDVIEHFRLKELVDKGENGRAWSTRDRYESYLDRWIGPRWGKQELAFIKAPIVEEWLKDLRALGIINLNTTLKLNLKWQASV